MNMNDLWTAVGTIVAVLTLVSGVYVAGHKAGFKKALRDTNNERDKKRFTEIYAPLLVLFTNCHITTVTGQGAPYIRQRASNALRFIKDRNFTQAFHAFFNKLDLGISGEVEYGGTFPLESINKQLRGREHFADSLLIDLVARSNRAQFEEQPECGELTSADLALFEHICGQYEGLAGRFVGA